ncbi:MAG: carbon-nitrogen hydrolase family protein [Armatimonadota bacterium]|nr:carbon-nitrogen hydrolase family protein [Armatimonadota bacterium]
MRVGSSWISALVMGAPIGALCAAAVQGAVTLQAPDGWQTYSVRPHLSPRFWVVRKGDGYLLAMAGTGDEAVDGRWQRRQPVVPGKHYAFAAQCRVSRVETPARSVLTRLRWFDAQDKQIGPTEYPSTAPSPSRDGWVAFSACYQAPDQAATAVLELHLRWAPRGEVFWRNISLRPAQPPSPRRVRLAAVNHRPKNSPSPQANLEAYAALVDQAAQGGADIVCLPEGITVVGTGQTYAAVAEPVPGPATRFLGACAARNRVYLVAGLYEWDGQKLYNTSVLLGRDGRLVGKYRKAALPREATSSITPLIWPQWC